MNTKKKGDRGVGRAICAFASRDWTVCIPITDSQDYDLVVDIPGEGLRKIQVKYISAPPYQAQLGIRGGTKGGVWKKPNEMVFDYLFIAAGDGTNWLVPRGDIRSAISVGKKAEYSFGSVAERQLHLIVNQASSTS